MKGLCKEAPSPLILGTAAHLSNGFGDLGVGGVHPACLGLTLLRVLALRPGRLKGKLLDSVGAFGLRVALI